MTECIINKCFHQICDKSSNNEIKCIRWSPASDLAAVIGKEGDVRLHRLYWQKVWSISEKDTYTRCISWQPEGNALAIGYDNGVIKLVEIEKGTVTASVDIGVKVVSLDWLFLNTENSESSCTPTLDSSYTVTEYVQSLITFTEVEQKSNGLSSESEKLPRVSKEPSRPNLLYAGGSDGSVTLLLNGQFKLAVVSIPNLAPDHALMIHSTAMSSQQSIISIAASQVSSDNSVQFSVSMFGSRLLSSRTTEISTLGNMFIFINSIVGLCNKVITQMSDSWEDILLRISSKLNKLDDMLPSESSVADEFLVAFVCGTASPELQSFLLHDLTLKGLKTLGNNVTTCYKEIEELVVQNLEVYCHTLMQCLTKVCGMSRWYDRYGILGLSEELVHQCIATLGSLLLKVREVIQVINSDLKNFRAFFRWVTGLVLRLSDESAQKNSKGFSQEHYARILYFLQTHLKKGSQEPYFQLERVGQYLKEETLNLKMEYSENPWYDFVSQNDELKRSSLVMHPNQENSLVASFSTFKIALDKLYNKTVEGISKSFDFQGTMELMSQDGMHSDYCQASLHQERNSMNEINLFCSPCSCNRSSFYRFKISQSPQNVCFQELSFSPMDLPFTKVRTFSELILRDVAYFDDNFLIVLINASSEESGSVDLLLQLDQCSLFKSEMKPFENIADLLSNASQGVNIDIVKMRVLDIGGAASLSVSGARKVASIVSKSCRRVQIFDIAGEEEEEENDTSQMLEGESFT